MHSSKHCIVPSVYLVLINEGKILLSRRFNTGFLDGFYSFPAGHLNGNETVRQAVVREGKEEVGVDVSPTELELIHVVSRKGHDAERVGFFFRAKSWQGTPAIMEKDKCDDLQWFALDAIPENTVDYVKQAITLFQTGGFYSEFGW
jgi:ADP-ribose pyrophosphatase YjhB (NUDIX family)